MFDIFQNTTRPRPDLFFQKNDCNDVRLGEIVTRSINEYAAAEIVILGCPQDDGVARNNGRIGAALAPDAIRAQFYKLTNFGIFVKIFDLGDTIIKKTLEETHDFHAQIVEQILRDDKRLIILGGGNDISYADGAAMSNIFGVENWLAFNFDAHFDVRTDFPRNSGTPYRQLLDEKLLKPSNFSEIGFQPPANSPIYFEYLNNLGVTMISFEEFKDSTNRIPEIIETKIAGLNSTAIFFGFDVDAVRASDAPGVSAPNPIGLSGEDLINLAEFAGKLIQTKIVEFTEVNPNFDIDRRTAKLVAFAMHGFCRALKQKS